MPKDSPEQSITTNSNSSTRRDFLKKIAQVAKGTAAALIISQSPQMRGTVEAVSSNSDSSHSSEFIDELKKQEITKREDEMMVQSLANAFAKGWVCNLDGPCEQDQLGNKDPEFWKEKSRYILDAVKATKDRDYSITASSPLILMKDGRILTEDEIKPILDENNKGAKDDFNHPVSGYFGINEYRAINRTEIIRANLATVIAVAVTETGGFLPKDPSDNFQSGPTIENALSVRSLIANYLSFLEFRGVSTNFPDRQAEILGTIDPFSNLQSTDGEYISDVDDLLITERVYGGLYLDPRLKGEIDLLSPDGKSLNYQLFRHHNSNPLWYKRANSLYQALQDEVSNNPHLQIIFKNIIN